jgi:hypothetical protein
MNILETIKQARIGMFQAESSNEKAVPKHHLAKK